MVRIAQITLFFFIQAEGGPSGWLAELPGIYEVLGSVLFMRYLLWHSSGSGGMLCAVHAVSAAALVGFQGNVMCEEVRVRRNDSTYFRLQSEQQTDNEKGLQGIVSCWLSFLFLKCLGSEIFPIPDIFGFWNICVDSPIWKFSLSNSSKTGFRVFSIYVHCVRAETQLWTQNQLHTDFRVESQRQSLQKSRSRQKPVFFQGQKTAQWSKKTRGPTDYCQKCNCSCYFLPPESRQIRRWLFTT